MRAAVYNIRLTRGAVAHERRRILDAISGQLAYEPLVATKNRKQLPGLAPEWAHIAPILELRVGSYRVFYDVDGEARTVIVRAVRLKRPSDTTGDIV
jgi:mRNA-degrading endonuclease RelE of RelBE toxin-antitoxin system